MEGGVAQLDGAGNGMQCQPQKGNAAKEWDQACHTLPAAIGPGKAISP